MKQPMINLFGNSYPVKSIEFDKNGVISSVVYRLNGGGTRTVFKNSKVPAKDLLTDIQITEPTPHPYHDYLFAPNLEGLLGYHREDAEAGAQKLQALYEKYVGSDDRKNRGIALGVMLASEALGITIPGIKDGRDNT